MGIFRRRQTAPADGHDDRQTTPTEFRAPTVATVSATQVARGMGMVRSDFDAAKATREHYLANTYLYAAVQALGEDIASLTLRAGPSVDRPGETNPDHPLIRLLGAGGRPNPQTTAAQLWKWTVAQFIVTGRFGWEIDQGDRSLWPLISTRIKPEASTGGAAYFRRFLYDVGEGKDKALAADRVVYHWRPSATDWRQPESVLQSARLDLSVAVMQDVYDFAFLQNDARPAAVVVHDAFADPDERDQWRSGFLDSHRGARNAGKVHFAEASPDGAAPKDALFVQTLGLSQKDAEFITRYEQKIKAVLTAVGVPLARLGDPTASTYANAHEAMKSYWKNKVRQLAIEMAGAVNQYLAPAYGSDVVWFDFQENEYLRVEPLMSVTDALAALEAGIVTPEEVRVRVLMLPAVPELGALPVAVEPPALPAVEPMPVLAPVDASQFALAASARLDEIAVRLAALSAPSEPPAVQPVIETTAVDVTERRESTWRAFDASTGALERRWQKRWQRLLDQQAEAALARLNGKRGRQALRDADSPDVDAVFDVDHWTDITRDLAADLYEDTLGLAFAAFDDATGIGFNVEAPFARGFIETRANMLSGQVTQTTYDGIKAAMLEGVQAGEGIDGIAARITGLFDQTYAGRAKTVARTEVISGYNGGTREAAAQTDGVVEKLEWIATRDDRTRDSHAEADGQLVAIGDSFSIGGYEMEYPGDPSAGAEEIVNCFVGDTRIGMVGDLSATWRRWYEGDVLEIVTGTGERLTVTPNHPILTPRGWVPAEALQQGDEVLRAWSSPEVQHAPTSIQEIYSAASERTPTRRIGGRRVDFHGDGSDREIDVVRADGVLAPVGDRASVQDRSDLVLVGLGDTQGSFASGGGTDASGREVAARLATGTFRIETRGSVRGGSQAPSFFGTRTSHPDQHRFAPAARREFGQPEPALNHVPTHAVALREREDGHPFLVEATKVVEVRRRVHSGHVFNLTVSSGLLVGNGILTSNCRCTIAPVVGESKSGGAGTVDRSFTERLAMRVARGDLRVTREAAARIVRGG